MNRPTALRLDESVCIACEACDDLVPELRTLGRQVPVTDAALDAMAACPTGAIRWADAAPDAAAAAEAHAAPDAAAPLEALSRVSRRSDVTPAPSSERDPMQTIDVRSIPPRDRHPLIFQTFDALEAGDAFELVNDHDPKPLYHQLRAERDGQLAWTYLVQGPELWRVRIGRKAAPEAAAEAAAPTYRAHADLVGLLGEIQPESIVSRQVVHDDQVKVTLFGFAAGQELSEHTASKPAILQVLSGEGTFGLGGEVIDVRAGSWAHMDANLPHTVTARTPLVLLLTLIKASKLA